METLEDTSILSTFLFVSSILVCGAITQIKKISNIHDKYYKEHKYVLSFLMSLMYNNLLMPVYLCNLFIIHCFIRI